MLDHNCGANERVSGILAERFSKQVCLNICLVGAIVVVLRIRVEVEAAGRSLQG